MPAVSPIATPSAGRTFLVAISLLGIVALAQVAAIGFAFVTRLPGGAGVQPSRTPGEAQTLARVVPGAPTFSVESLEANPFAEGGPAFDLPMTPPPPPRPSPVPLATLEPLPPESRFQELVTQGRTLRQRGDMTNALTRLREAQALDPRNPLAIAELAHTYEEMALTDRAAEQWRRIYEMGKSAGVYYAAAEAKLRQSQTQTLMSLQRQPSTAAGGSPVSSTSPGALMGLGEISANELRDPKAAKRFILRVPVKTRPQAKIDVRDVTIHVLFYDMLEGKEIVQTNANVSSRWSTAPADWANGETEILEVDYIQPQVRVSDAPLDDRKYFGRIVSLYYKDELQDTAADPARLAAQFPAPQILSKDSPAP